MQYLVVLHLGLLVMVKMVIALLEVVQEVVVTLFLMLYLMEVQVDLEL